MTNGFGGQIEEIRREWMDNNKICRRGKGGTDESRRV